MRTSEQLLHNHRGEKARVSTLLIQSRNPDILMKAIIALEKAADVYIERFPAIKKGELRKDLSPSDIVYFDAFPSIKRKSLLYQTGVEYGDFTINHVLGCTHGCRYPCYASMISKRYGRVKGYADWRRPRIVQNALELLESEIPKLQDKIRFVHLSFMTDPFMYDSLNGRTIPWIQKLTLDILENLSSVNIRSTVLTKGAYPSVLVKERYHKENEYGISLSSMNTKFHRQYEPFSLVPKKRIKSLRALHEKELRTWVSLEPYPTPNIVDQSLDDMLSEVEFVDKIIFGRWNYCAKIREYAEMEEFYLDAVEKVIDFAAEKGIPYHIKEKTPGSSKETEGIFC